MSGWLIAGVVKALDAVAAFTSRLSTVLRKPNKPVSDSKETVAPETELDSDDDRDDSNDDWAEFFPDKPSRRDSLDYKSYAETLADLIAPKETQTPLTVGVFGAWGSGKTTLMRMIKAALSEKEKEPDSQRFVFVHFDAWKYYKEDALWRAMLLRVLDALRRRLKPDSDAGVSAKINRLEDSLYRAVEWQEKGGLTIDWPKLVKAGAGGAVKLSFSFVPGLSSLVEAVKAAQGKLGEGTIAEDVSAVASAFHRNIVTHHQNQLHEIEQFQRGFFSLVKNYFKNQRLVIFVDDLDRCLPEKAIEVLEAIKLFLDVKGCVFILGLDQEVITRGLQVKYKELAFLDQNEQLTFSRHYVEKLIQLPFYLPPIESREVRKYIDSLKVKWPEPDCAEVFAEVLSPNPRQIKRTINVYMLLWKLAEKRRKGLEAVTALRLAKVVILQTAYPGLFDQLKSDARLLQQLEIACDAHSATDNSSLDPIVVGALKQPGLTKLFRLLADKEKASFAKLEEGALSSFFSLARRAPLVTEIRAKDAAANVPLEEIRSALVPERPFQLRPSVGDFVGREADLNRIVTALRTDKSIAVVTGMAGSGKTEFAFRVAERLRVDYPDGQLFVDMLGTEETPADSAEALSACIRALTGRLHSNDPHELGANYRSHLNNRRVLIMLDNALDASQVIPLIPPKGSALLITSRNALVLPGMINVTLEQLSVEDAIMLLRNISPHVSREIAAEICALCGYLPPAVRAAASMLAATADLDPEAYARQLRDEQRRIEVLGASGLDVKLEASFSVSYSRLQPDARRVFRRLPIFPGSFDAKAEEHICDDPDHAHLSELVKLNLVFYDPSEKRYRVHALLRLFAKRQLEKGENNSTAERHAKYYLEVLKNADALYSKGGIDIIEGLLLYDRERENIEAGFRWSETHLTSVPDAAAICSGYAKFAAQILELRQNNPNVRIVWFERGVSAARRLNDPRAELTHLIDLGRAHGSSKETNRAIDILSQALDKATKLEVLPAQALILSNLGVVHRNRGDIQKAIECFEAQLEILKTLDDPRRETAALVNLANALLLTINPEEAIKYLEAAAVVSKRTADLQTQGMVLGNMGRAYNKLGDPKRALEYCRQQLEVSRKLGDKEGEAAAHLNIGIALELDRKLEEARAAFNTSLEIYRKLQSDNAKIVEGWLAELDRELAD
ncbi:MAG TPA: P-loop NTPase fold protein [Pyrinomonadaceae bacterium]